MPREQGVVVRGIAFYGKGGIGKTTVSSTVSALFAASGRRVLHIGCDPKHDSCYSLVPRGDVRTVLGMLQAQPQAPLTKADLVMKSPLGIDCIEAGGPEPGVGCAGRGITRTFEVLHEANVLDGSYDVGVFDVLGDVVCGGFAVPMRSGLASEVYVVLSGEVMALYAANNICRALARFSRNGIRLGGLVANLRSAPREIDVLGAFATALGTRLLHPIPFDETVQRAERASRTVVAFAPESEAAGHYRSLFAEIDSTAPEALHVPTPLDDGGFERFLSSECFR